MIIIGAAVLVIGIAIGAYFFLFAGDDAEETTDTEQVEVVDDEETTEEESVEEDAEAEAEEIADDAESTDTTTETATPPVEEAGLENTVTNEPAMDDTDMPESTRVEGAMTDNLINDEANPLEESYDPRQDRLAGIAAGFKDSGGLKLDFGKQAEQPKTEPLIEEESLELDVAQTPQDKVIEEFGSLKALADEIIKLRKQKKLLERETRSAYALLEELEKELKTKNRIIRAQDSYYTKGGTIKKKRDDSPVATPEPTWDIAPEHQGP
jgi:cytoskeletal protein RodZ